MVEAAATTVVPPKRSYYTLLPAAPCLFVFSHQATVCRVLNCVTTMVLCVLRMITIDHSKQLGSCPLMNFQACNTFLTLSAMSRIAEILASDTRIPFSCTFLCVQLTQDSEPSIWRRYRGPKHSPSLKPEKQDHLQPNLASKLWKPFPTVVNRHQTKRCAAAVAESQR